MCFKFEAVDFGCRHTFRQSVVKHVAAELPEYDTICRKNTARNVEHKLSWLFVRWVGVGGADESERLQDWPSVKQVHGWSPYVLLSLSGRAWGLPHGP